MLECICMNSLIFQTIQLHGGELKTTCIKKKKKSPMYKFAQILQSGHLTNKIRVFKEMNTWTHRHTWLFNLQTADPLLPLSSFFPNSCQRDCLQLPHHAQLELWCVCGQWKWIQCCRSNGCFCGCCTFNWYDPVWDCTSLCVHEWRLVWALSLQLCCHWDRNIRVAAHHYQGIYPSCVNACVLCMFSACL